MKEYAVRIEATMYVEAEDAQDAIDKIDALILSNPSSMFEYIEYDAKEAE